jgi:hypothetical protein
MKQVNVVDSVSDILMIAMLREEHYVEMCNRGWIKSIGWIVPGQRVEVIEHTHLIAFLRETGLD